MKKLKVKVSDLNLENLEKVKRSNIAKAKAFLQYCPFATVVYLSMKTGLPIPFIQANKEEIFSDV